MRGRIVEDETGGVVLVEQRIAVFRRKLLLLVGAEGFCALVGADQIVIAGQKVGAVGHELDRLMLPQCTISRVGVGIELRRQFLEGETCPQTSSGSIHPAMLLGGY